MGTVVIIKMTRSEDEKKIGLLMEEILHTICIKGFTRHQAINAVQNLLVIFASNCITSEKRADYLKALISQMKKGFKEVDKNGRCDD